MSLINWQQRIQIDPELHHGDPCIRGTRIPVSTILGSLAEATVLVAECGVTSRQFALGAVKRLRSTRTRLVGGVLTKVDTRNRSYGYHSYYYQYDDADVKRLTT